MRLIATRSNGIINHYELVVADPSGSPREARLPPREQLWIVAVTNFNERVRKTMHDCFADCVNYAVLTQP